MSSSTSPRVNSFDTLVVYHGTVWYDDKSCIDEITLGQFIEILDRTDMMVIGVAYPEENLLMGEDIIYAEAALLWVRQAPLPRHRHQPCLSWGHSQGSYIVTQLNTLHRTDGVVTNCPGPLDSTIAVSSKRTMKSNPAISASSSTKPSAALKLQTPITSAL